jgi:TM2 domain-containing membrane protein YozV
MTEIPVKLTTVGETQMIRRQGPAFPLDLKYRVHRPSHRYWVDRFYHIWLIIFIFCDWKDWRFFAISIKFYLNYFFYFLFLYRQNITFYLCTCLLDYFFCQLSFCFHLIFLLLVLFLGWKSMSWNSEEIANLLGKLSSLDGGYFP